jgi:hypothetical protein
MNNKQKIYFTLKFQTGGNNVPAHSLSWTYDLRAWKKITFNILYSLIQKKNKNIYLNVEQTYTDGPISKLT